MENNKIIVWIDDSDAKMEQVVEGAFIELWKAGIFTQTVFYGDYEKQVDQDALDRYRQMVLDQFYMLYDLYAGSVLDVSELGSGVHGLYEGYFKEDFFSNADQNRDNEHYHNIAFCLPDEAKNIEKIESLWNTKSVNNTKDLSKESDDLVAPFFEGIPNAKDVAYALDLVLLKKDEDNLKCDEKDSKPIISMALYHYITQTLHAPCVLYSRYTYLNLLENNWKKRYQIIYGIDAEINIYSRDGLYCGNLDPNTINALKSACIRR